MSLAVTHSPLNQLFDFGDWPLMFAKPSQKVSPSFNMDMQETAEG